MNIHEWHRNGLTPSFATVEQWIYDQLGFFEAEDEACYALSVRTEDDRRGLAVRVLVASDKGLFDIVWERPEQVADRRVVTRHHRWADVRGFHLSAETRLDAQTLMHGKPDWRVDVEVPEVVIDEPVDDEALLAFWSASMRELDKVARK